MLALRCDAATGAGRDGVALTPRLALLMTLPPLLWAGNAVVGRLLVGQVPPAALNALRWLLAAAILLPLGWRALRQRQAIAASWRYLALLGLLGVGLFNTLQYLALVSSTPVNTTLVACSLPVWMLALGALLFGEHPTRRQLLGAALGLAGVAVVISRGDPAALARVQFVRGDLIMLAAVLGWALYSWLLARPPRALLPAPLPGPAQGWDWAGVLLVQTLFGLAASGLFVGIEQAAGAAPIRWSGWLAAALLYVALGASVLAYRCWGLAVARGGPALAAFFNNLTPLFAALLSALLLGEPPNAYHGLAFVLIAGGIAVSMAWPQAPAAAPPGAGPHQASP